MVKTRELPLLKARNISSVQLMMTMILRAKHSQLTIGNFSIRINFGDGVGTLMFVYVYQMDGMRGEQSFMKNPYEGMPAMPQQNLDVPHYNMSMPVQNPYASY